MKLRKGNVFAISMAVLILIGFHAVGAWMGGRSFVDLSEEIEIAFEAIPKRLESESALWLQNRVVPVPSNQEAILRLTSSVSREYTRMGTFPPVKATLFIAFCQDARSMVGHHPPVCYPASGWRLHSSDTQTRTVRYSDVYEIEYSLFRFSNSDLELSVASGFFAAPGLFTGSMSEAEAQVQPSLLGGQGLCQFQILFQGALSGSDLHQYVSEILRGIPAVVFDAATDADASVVSKSRINGVTS